MADGLPATTVDPDGRTVALTAERWGHITEGHPELAAYQTEILETVRVPSRRRPGPTLGEQWFYREDVGPSRWLKVVVRFESIDRGIILTAFARRSMP
jgi:carbonic anhydrase